MITRGILIFTIVTFFSCGEKKQGRSNSENSQLDSLNNPINFLNIQTSSFSEVDSSGILIFPLSMGESERSSGSLIYKEVPNYSNWNIIFWNSKSNEYHLLTDKKVLIREYNLNSENETNGNRTYNAIYYKVTSFDYNNDKLLNDKDPDYLYISDREGNNFRRISPELYTLINWYFIRSSNKVVMTVKKDSDNDKEFDDDDEISTFEIDINKETEPRQVFFDDFKKKLKVLYDRDWKRLKK